MFLRQQIKCSQGDRGLKTLRNLTRDVFIGHRDAIKRWLCRLHQLEGEVATFCLETTGSWEKTRLRLNQSLSFGHPYTRIYHTCLDGLKMILRVGTRRGLRIPTLMCQHPTTMKPLMRTSSISASATKDKFTFKNLFVYFASYVASVGSKAARFKYPKRCKRFSLLIIQHLSNSHQKYEIALSLLK